MPLFFIFGKLIKYFALLLLLGIANVVLHAQSATVESFGAVGNGVTDDGAALQAAYSSGIPNIIHGTGKTYRTGRFLGVSSGKTLIGDSSVIKPTVGLAQENEGLLTVTGTVTIVDEAVSINVVKGSANFTYSKAASVKPGYIVILFGPVYATYSGSNPYSKGWYGPAASVAGTTVTMQNASNDSYTATRIKVLKPATGITIQGITFDVSDRTTGYAINLPNVTNSTVQGCLIKGAYAATGVQVGISAKGCNLLFDGNKLINIRPLATTGNKYGINMEGWNITAQNNWLENIPTSLTSAGRYYYSTGITYKNNTIYHLHCTPGHSMDFHGNAQGRMTGNLIYTKHDPISVRCNNIRVDHNTIYYTYSKDYARAIYGFETLYDNLQLDSNTLVFTGSGIKPAFFTNSGGGQLAPLANLRIFGNEIYGGRIGLVGSLGTPISIYNNNFYTANGFVPYILPSQYNGSGNMFNGSGTPPTPPDIPDPDAPPPVETDGGCDSCYYLIHWKANQ